jgi:glycosyltransferase involved in cell wall biosynthesis
MKIVQLVHKPQRRGAEVSASLLARTHRAQGHDVVTYYLFEHTGKDRLELAPGDRVFGEKRAEGAFIHFATLWRLWRAVRSARPHVLQANGGATLKYAAALRALGLGRTVLVYRNIGMPSAWIQSHHKKLFYGRFVRAQLDGIVAISEASRAELVGLYGDRAQIETIPGIVDANQGSPARNRSDLCSAAGTPQDNRIVLFVGALTPEKRVDRLPSLLAALVERHPKTSLWVVGDGPEGAALAAGLAAGSGSYYLWGPQTDMQSLYCAADVLVLCSDTEGIPGVILEAAACSLPSVAFAVGGVRECVPEGTGLVVPAGDVDGLAHATARLLADDATRAALGRAAQSRAHALYSAPEVARRFTHFYHRLSEPDNGITAEATR